MQTTVVETRRERVPLNGVDTPTLFATINAVKGAPELAQFQFRASNRWVQGTHSRTVIESFTGAGSSHMHARSFEYDADHPVGARTRGRHRQFLLHALGTASRPGSPTWRRRGASR
jgi:hypothetical protein